MTTLTAITYFKDDEHKQAVVKVHTSRCWYNVAVRKGEVTVTGPGIEETFNFNGEGLPPAEDLNYKGMALVAVTLLEEKD